MSNHVIVAGPAFVSANLLCRILQTSPQVYFANPEDRFTHIFESEKFIDSKITIDSSVNWDSGSSLESLYSHNFNDTGDSIRSNHRITVDEILQFEKHFPPNTQQVYFIHARRIFDNNDIVQLLSDNRFVINVYLNPMHELSLQAMKIYMDRCFFHIPGWTDGGGHKEIINDWSDNDYFSTISNMLYHMLEFTWPHNYGLAPEAIPILQQHDKIINVPMMDILDIDKVMLLGQRLNLKLDYNVVKSIINAYIRLNKYEKYPLIYPNLDMFKHTKMYKKHIRDHNGIEIDSVIQEVDNNAIINKLINNAEIRTDLISQNMRIGEVYDDFTNIYELFLIAVRLAEEFKFHKALKNSNKTDRSLLKTHEFYPLFEKKITELTNKNSKIIKNLPKLAVF